MPCLDHARGSRREAEVRCIQSAHDLAVVLVENIRAQRMQQACARGLGLHEEDQVPLDFQIFQQILLNRLQIVWPATGGQQCCSGMGSSRHVLSVALQLAAAAERGLQVFQEQQLFHVASAKHNLSESCGCRIKDKQPGTKTPRTCGMNLSQRENSAPEGGRSESYVFYFLRCRNSTQAILSFRYRSA